MVVHMSDLILAIFVMKDEHPDNIDHKAISEVSKELVNKPKQNIKPSEEDDVAFTIIKENVNSGEEVSDDEGKQMLRKKVSK